MRLAFLATLAFVTSACSDETAPDRANDTIGASQTVYDQIEKVELQINLPEGAESLDRYDRYYILNQDKFEAAYFLNKQGSASVMVVETKDEIPFVLDGGCAVIHISGSLSSPDEMEAFCNGVA